VEVLELLTPFLTRTGIRPVLCAAPAPATPHYRDTVLERFTALAIPHALAIEEFIGAGELATLQKGALLNFHPPVYDAYGMTVVEAAAFATPSVLHAGGEAAVSLPVAAYPDGLPYPIPIPIPAPAPNPNPNRTTMPSRSAAATGSSAAIAVDSVDQRGGVGATTLLFDRGGGVGAATLLEPTQGESFDVNLSARAADIAGAVRDILSDRARLRAYGYGVRACGRIHAARGMLLGIRTYW
jgi:hypothetical protein